MERDSEYLSRLIGAAYDAATGCAGWNEFAAALNQVCSGGRPAAAMARF